MHPTYSQSSKISYLMPFLRTSVPAEYLFPSLRQDFGNQVHLMAQERNLHRYPSVTENEYQRKMQHLYFLRKLYHHGYVLHDDVVGLFLLSFLVFLSSSRKGRSIIITLRTNSLHTQSLTLLLKPMFSPSVKVLPHILT